MLNPFCVSLPPLSDILVELEREKQNKVYISECDGVLAEDDED